MEQLTKCIDAKTLACVAVLVLAGCAGPARATDAPADLAQSGQKLYVAKCAKCHKFYDPAKYSEVEWKLWMDKMSRKAKLKPEQQEAVSRYIETTLRSKPPKQQPAAAQPGS